MEKTRWFLPLYRIYGCQGQGAQRSLSFVGGVRKSLFPKFMEEPQRATVTHSGASRASEGKRNFVPALSNHLSWLSARLSPGCGRGLFCPHSGSCHLLVAGLWAPAGKLQIWRQLRREKILVPSESISREACQEWDHGFQGG